MQKINFKNLPSTDTSIDATNLNLMQDNIESAIDTVAGDIPTVVDSLTGSSTTDAPSVHAVKGLIKYIDKTFSNFSTTTYWNVYRVQFPISDLSVSPDKILSIIVTNFMQMGAVLNVLTDSNYLTIINDSSVTNAGTITLRIWYLDI